MNAVLREESEVPVISNDAIEVKLNHLSDGLQEVRAQQTVLQARIEKTNDRIDVLHSNLSDKIDKTNERIDIVNTTLSARIEAVNANLSARIEAVNANLSARIEAVNANLSAKIDSLQQAIFARFDKQDERISALSKGVDWVHISVKVVLAILGLCVSAAVIVNTLRTLRWI